MIEEIKKSINESATTAKKMAENNVDSVVVGLATKVVITALSGIAAKGFSFINDDIKYKNMIDRTWEILPLPIRLLGKDVINYDENMYFLRKQIFGKSYLLFTSLSGVTMNGVRFDYHDRMYRWSPYLMSC